MLHALNLTCRLYNKIGRIKASQPILRSPTIITTTTLDFARNAITFFAVRVCLQKLKINTTNKNISRKRRVGCIHRRYNFALESSLHIVHLKANLWKIDIPFVGGKTLEPSPRELRKYGDVIHRK